MLSGIPTDARALKKSRQNNIEEFDTCLRSYLVSWRQYRTNKSILEELDVDRELMAKVEKTEVNSILNMLHVFIFF